LFGLISRISSHPAVFFSHNKPANSTFSIINQRNEQAGEKKKAKCCAAEEQNEGGREEHNDRSGTGRATLRTGQKRPCLLFSPLLPSERDAEKRKNSPSPISSLLVQYSLLLLVCLTRNTAIRSSPQGQGNQKRKRSSAH
jgi:hypothetical protein